MEENENMNSTETEAKPEGEAKPAESTEAEPAKEEPVSEIKSMLKGLVSTVESLSADVKALKEAEIANVKSPESKANSKAVQTSIDTQALGSETKSAQAGLSLLR